MLPHVRTATLLAGPAFVVAYAFGLISVSQFLGRYGLQATELLRARYLSIGLSAIVLVAPTVLCLNLAESLARRGSLAWEKKSLRWKRPILAALFCGAATFGTWLLWSSILTSFELVSAVRLPIRVCLTVGIAAGAVALRPFFFFGNTKDRRLWIPLMAILWSLLVCTTLSNVLQYMPPWAGGYSTRPVRVIMRESDLQEYVSGGVVVIEATRDRYIFWDMAGDKLIEVPSDCVKAIIAGPDPHDAEVDGQ